MRQDLRIIVEGMDGTGKSTLIEHLKSQFHNLEIVRNDLGPQQDFNTWWPAQLDREKSAMIPLHDRFFYSELVYGPTLRGSLAVDENIAENVKWFLRNTSLLIYARPFSETIRSIVNASEQMSGVRDHFDNLLFAYDQLMSAEKTWYKGRFVHYDWRKEREMNRIDRIVEDYILGKALA